MVPTLLKFIDDLSVNLRTAHTVTLGITKYQQYSAAFGSTSIIKMSSLNSHSFVKSHDILVMTSGFHWLLYLGVICFVVA